MKISEIINYLETLAPLAYQEHYDNSGLIIGERDNDVTKSLITLDVTESVINEAIAGGFNLIIAHHPMIFGTIKKITGASSVEKMIVKAIKNDIAIYAIHTNFDNVEQGVNSIIAEKIGLKNTKILAPLKGKLRKLVTFCPLEHADNVRKALFLAGAGQIGNYNSCSFNLEGQGTFKAGEGANPFVGEIDKLHTESEVRIETIFPFNIEKQVLSALFAAHPYEEVAFDIYPLENEFAKVGAGMIGELENEEDETEFLERIKKIFNTACIRHSGLLNKKIKKVALCGGSGSFLITNALQVKADIFITGDIKYHQFFDAEEKIILADIGHFESEQFTKQLLLTLLIKKFPKFAVQISAASTNAVKYL